jgi:hypothetical protein
MVGRVLKTENANSYKLRVCVLKVRIIGLEPTRLNTQSGTFDNLPKTLQK